MAETPLERVLAPFSMKGPAIKRVRKPDDDEHYFDITEREFRPYKRSGVKDPNSGAEVVGNEEEFVAVAREARDDRLVGVASGQVVRAVGSLKEGTGMLVDLYGRPLSQGNVQQAPVTRTKRSPRDW
jgi:hypothetical protein